MTKTHNKSNTKLHLVWITMRQRCNNDKSQRFELYGGRGIKVCREWDEDFMSFYRWSLSNGYKEGLSIDRIDNNGDYEPDNCRWVDQKEQNNNTRRTNFITYKGKTQSLKQWSEELNLNYSTLRSRLRIGWSVEESFEIKMEGRGNNGNSVHYERKRRQLLSNRR